MGSVKEVAALADGAVPRERRRDLNGGGGRRRPVGSVLEGPASGSEPKSEAAVDDAASEVVPQNIWHRELLDPAADASVSAAESRVKGPGSGWHWEELNEEGELKYFPGSTVSGLAEVPGDMCWWQVRNGHCASETSSPGVALQGLVLASGL